MIIMGFPNEFKFNIEEDVDFDINSMNFNKYELADNTILRLLCVPMKILKLKEKNPQGFPQYFIGHKNIVSALVPSDLRGEPTNSAFEQKKAKLTIVDYKPILEPWNNFELADGTTMRIRLIVNQVLISDHYNMHGEPIYVVHSDISVGINFKNFKKMT